jgi:hypothetical protein
MLKHAVQPCTMIAEVAQSAVSSTPFAPASTVLGAAIFLVQAADGISEAYNWIETLFNRLAGFTQRLEQYAGSNTNPYLQQKLISILSYPLELIGCSEMIMKEGRFRRYAASSFLGKDDVLKAAFDRLNDLFKDEHRLVQAIEWLDGLRRFDSISRTKISRQESKLENSSPFGRLLFNSKQSIFVDPDH